MENNELKRLYTLYYLKEDKPLTFCQWKETIGNTITEYDRKCVQCGKKFKTTDKHQITCCYYCHEQEQRHNPRWWE